MINGDYPDFANYTRKHRKPLFVLLDNNDNFELRKPQLDGYLHTDKYRSYNWPASSQGLRRCCNIDSVQGCQDNTCYHYASAIICDADNCVNVYCKNKIGSQPIDPTRYFTTFAPSNDTGIGICATDLIPKATIIGHYVGDIMPNHIHEARQDFLQETCPEEHAISYHLTYDRNHVIDARRHGNILRYTNHSC
jgi:SET domain-containing protein